jgi:5-formyltetrahydrofolate cyclo-ligase
VIKKELRQELRRRMADIPPEELSERSALACGRLVEVPEYRRAEIVMIFLSMPKEVDTRHIALHCWSNLKRVLAPKVSWEQRRMLPIEIKSLTSDVRAGVMGIREPTEGMPIPVADIDLVIVPGLGFDAAGNRLGRGRGFYDGFLSHRDFRGVSCALALEDQVVENVPSDQTDVRVQMLVTDARVRRFKR